ncbi:GNAT family N-acetyltransferase/peptidase C39 family protein [Alteromonas sp. ASW11-36]|uniref:GNAT family N-acetyltransferase/peptidase C39 family protein n=1 Tax=Alteromonas arenosi TaxID=3055817 RepID=A0ABT7SZK7_9ALTE|nr:GNAT family N-acetyltransferase/peptidase C39 family protein [Alteromonas sp. ASW11-36]MDM7861439.1 GNAT family N-acetyltransferase/peptidase C39 family protein [Alteromonas sp. ASW11-36]
MVTNSSILAETSIRSAQKTDLDQLVAIENAAFNNDRISRKRFVHWLKAENCVFLVAQREQRIVGYGLVLLRKGTRLARLYSIAIEQHCAGQGIGKALLLALEHETLKTGRLYMRLEVASNNTAAQRLYLSIGYKPFGSYADYYDNHIDAIRMQKSIRQAAERDKLPWYPWYRQTTPFTCGPASLIMAMQHLERRVEASQTLELALWREATTIYMTSGHGGCHPYGLALAAIHRGFDAAILVSQTHGLFADGVRDEHKKQVMHIVEQDFAAQLSKKQVHIDIGTANSDWIEAQLKDGNAVLTLISTYHMTGYKTPHWVCITHCDQDCFYLHDPDMDEDSDNPFEFQHIPVGIDDLVAMCGYGKRKLHAFVVLSRSANALPSTVK